MKFLALGGEIRKFSDLRYYHPVGGVVRGVVTSSGHGNFGVTTPRTGGGSLSFLPTSEILGTTPRTGEYYLGVWGVVI